MLIEPDYRDISLGRQCDLLGIARSTYYHTPAGESSENLALMRALDEIYTEHPYYGRRRMTVAANRDYGFNACEKRVGRLLKVMGIQAIYPKPISVSQGKITLFTRTYYETLE